MSEVKIPEKLQYELMQQLKIGKHPRIWKERHW
jgi:hypothetical protein